MSKLLEKSMDELCANTVDTVDRIMGRYNVGLEEACSVAPWDNACAPEDT